MGPYQPAHPRPQRRNLAQLEHRRTRETVPDRLRPLTQIHISDLALTLDDLLRTEPAAAWAQTFLRRLQAAHRRTLQAWIDANTDAQQAARSLGISRNTVRTHLRTAEALLGSDLLTTGAGIHDVVHALHITTAEIT
ncbi:helix-turn-helix domain-containing protein [Nonomuraea sp. CA-141351]|uniref:helix-turn-helix domain-containing protein n=1 Tax=Nonomuraea sp. CA-141351 TaxID=3239996 RepID=UPI003D931F52